MVKEGLWRHLLARIHHDSAVSLVDSFPMPVHRFGRTYRCRLLPEEAAFGYYEMAKQTFYGLRAHLRVCWPGGICGASLASANVRDLSVAEELLEGVGRGRVLGDRNYHNPTLSKRLDEKGVALLTPHKKANKNERRPWPRFLVQKRRRIETVVSPGILARRSPRRK